MKKENLVKGGWLIFVFVIFILITNNSFAGTGTWARYYSDGRITAIGQAPDGNFIVAGITSHLSGYYAIWLFKLDASGNVKWSKAYVYIDYSTGFFNGFAHDVVVTSDGGYAVGGRFISDAGGFYGEVLILKVNEDGNIQWMKKYDIGNDVFPHSIKQTLDGGYVVAGTLYHYGILGFIIKVDAEGNVEWRKAYAYGEGLYFNHIAETSAGGFIAGGGRVVDGGRNNDGILIRLDSTGNILWSRTYNAGRGEDFRGGLSETQEGGFLAMGYTSTRYRSDDAWIVKVDSEGNVEWKKTLGTEKQDALVNMTSLQDGNFVMTGVIDVEYHQGDAWIVKMDPQGNILWEKAYGGPPTEVWDCKVWDDNTQDCIEWGFFEVYPREVGYAVLETWDGRLMVAGDGPVLRLNKNGNIPGCPYIRDVSTASVDIASTVTDISINVSVPDISVSSSPRQWKYAIDVETPCDEISCGSPSGCLPPSEYSFFPSLKNPPWPIWSEHKYKTDINCDGCVDELIEFSYSFGSFCGDDWHNSDADFDDNGYVDGMDLSIFVNDFGAGCF